MARTPGLAPYSPVQGVQHPWDGRTPLAKTSLCTQLGFWNVSERIRVMTDM